MFRLTPEKPAQNPLDQHELIKNIREKKDISREDTKNYLGTAKEHVKKVNRTHRAELRKNIEDYRTAHVEALKKAEKQEVAEGLTELEKTTHELDRQEQQTTVNPPEAAPQGTWEKVGGGVKDVFGKIEGFMKSIARGVESMLPLGLLKFMRKYMVKDTGPLGMHWDDMIQRGDLREIMQKVLDPANRNIVKPADDDEESFKKLREQYDQRLSKKTEAAGKDAKVDDVKKKYPFEKFIREKCETIRSKNLPGPFSIGSLVEMKTQQEEQDEKSAEEKKADEKRTEAEQKGREEAVKRAKENPSVNRAIHIHALVKALNEAGAGIKVNEEEKKKDLDGSRQQDNVDVYHSTMLRNDIVAALEGGQKTLGIELDNGKLQETRTFEFTSPTTWWDKNLLPGVNFLDLLRTNPTRAVKMLQDPDIINRCSDNNKLGKTTLETIKDVLDRELAENAEPVATVAPAKPGKKDAKESKNA